MIRRVAPILTLLASSLVQSCQGAGKGGDGSADGDVTVYASSGAQIFYSATSPSGSPILVSDNFGDTPRPASRSCADCHGPDGSGAVIRTDSGTARTPAIHYSRLADPETYAGGRGYDEARLALTLRSGVRLDGYLLSPAMPRWTLSGEDMKSLIEHLKTLGPQPTAR